MSLVLNADKISKNYGDRKIFESFSLKFYSGDRVGITGPNGAGKTTLLKVLAGLEQPDAGTVKTYTSLSFLRQQDDGVPEASAPLSQNNLSARIAGCLEFDTQDCHANLSGGEKAKVRFIQGFDPACGLLIADEPTSNLDLESVTIIRKELENFSGTLLIVSHDRDLLDGLCHTMIEIANGEVHVYAGNYSDYVRQRDALHDRQSFEYEAYVGERSRLKNRINERAKHMKEVKKTPSRMGNSEARLHKRGSTGIQKKLNQSIDQLESRLEKLDRKERPNNQPQVSIKIEPSEKPVSSRIVRADSLSLSFNGKELFINALFEIPTGERTAVLGRNGSGKTTLANLISNHDARLVIAPGVQIGYFMQDFSILDEHLTVIENIMELSDKPEHEVRGILARLLISADNIGKKVCLISGGEKVKVSIAKLLVSKSNFIILDEPTNYLDVFSMEALEKVLCDYSGTLLLISHDRKFIENIAQRLLIIEGGSIKTYEGSLKEYSENQKRKPGLKKNMTLLEETILQMNLAELSAKIYSCTDETRRRQLENQYHDLLNEKNN